MILLICLIGIIPAKSQRLHVYYFLYTNECGMEHSQLQVQLALNRFLGRKWLISPKSKKNYRWTNGIKPKSFENIFNLKKNYPTKKKLPNWSQKFTVSQTQNSVS